MQLETLGKEKRRNIQEVELEKIPAIGLQGPAPALGPRQYWLSALSSLLPTKRPRRRRRLCRPVPGEEQSFPVLNLRRAARQCAQAHEGTTAQRTPVWVLSSLPGTAPRRPGAWGDRRPRAPARPARGFSGFSVSTISLRVLRVDDFLQKNG